MRSWKRHGGSRNGTDAVWLFCCKQLILVRNGRVDLVTLPTDTSHRTVASFSDVNDMTWNARSPQKGYTVLCPVRAVAHER